MNILLENLEKIKILLSKYFRNLKTKNIDTITMKVPNAVHKLPIFKRDSNESLTEVGKNPFENSSDEFPEKGTKKSLKKDQKLSENQNSNSDVSNNSLISKSQSVPNFRKVGQIGFRITKEKDGIRINIQG